MDEHLYILITFSSLLIAIWLKSLFINYRYKEQKAIATLQTDAPKCEGKIAILWGVIPYIGYEINWSLFTIIPFFIYTPEIENIFKFTALLAITVILSDFLLFYIRTLLFGRQGFVYLTSCEVIVFPQLLSNKYERFLQKEVVFNGGKHTEYSYKCRKYYEFYFYHGNKFLFYISEKTHSQVESFMEYIEQTPITYCHNKEIAFREKLHPDMLFLFFIIVCFLIATIRFA